MNLKAFTRKESPIPADKNLRLTQIEPSMPKQSDIQPVWLKWSWLDLYVLDQNWCAACEGLARILEARRRPKQVAECFEKGSLASISVYSKGGIRDSSTLCLFRSMAIVFDLWICCYLLSVLISIRGGGQTFKLNGSDFIG